uniref:Lymphocyte specific protein 1 a n=1 Tax=Oreochromis niloticus TaxID=8128 RepID=A0A669CJ52_ORENI
MSRASDNRFFAQSSRLRPSVPSRIPDILIFWRREKPSSAVTFSCSRWFCIFKFLLIELALASPSSNREILVSVSSTLTPRLFTASLRDSIPPFTAVMSCATCSSRDLIEVSSAATPSWEEHLASAPSEGVESATPTYAAILGGRTTCLPTDGEACRVKGEVGVQKEQEEKDENNKHEQEREEEEVQPTLQKEWRSTETRQTARDDEQEEEELNFTHEVKGDLHHTREWRHKNEKKEAKEDNEEEERTLQNKRLTDSRDQWSEEENRSSAISLCSSSDGEESLNCYGPMSPTFKKLLIQFYPDEVSSRISADGKCKITERTESLRRSTSNIKKTLPPLPVSKIDKRLEQYTHALELSSKEGRSGCQTVTDLTAPAEPVASKKNLFEAGDAWNQNATSITASKDADALKVGVADLINQWVKGSEDGSRCSSPSKPAEIKPGGVLNKKNLWESLGDTLSSGKEGKESSTGKRYKFVVTGHGKYEKVSVDSRCSEDINCQSGERIF